MNPQSYEFEELIVNIVSLVFAFVGGCFALWQWRRSLVYKRTEIIQKLIDTVRCDKDVSSIMDMIDWNEGFIYDGKFHISSRLSRMAMTDLSDDDLFVMIDKTLSIFNYICYLKKVLAIKRSDMKFFEYVIRRLVDNQHIANYLYSLHHWTGSLNVKMSFSYVVDYCLRKKYLDKAFEKYSKTGRYQCFLRIGSDYVLRGN